MEGRERRSERIKREREEAPAERAQRAPRTRKGKVVKCALLNVRETADMKGKILGKLAKGDEVVILGQENGFYKIKDGDGEAYVSSGFVEIEG